MEAYCTDRCAEFGDPPCSRVAPEEGHCNDCQDDADKFIWIYREVAPPSSADLLYLVRLADWAAGQGFCQIEGIEDPEEWCFRRWSELGPPNGDGYSADALAQAIEARRAETGTGSVHESAVSEADAPNPSRQNISDVLIEALEGAALKLEYIFEVTDDHHCGNEARLKANELRRTIDALRQAKGEG